MSEQIAGRKWCEHCHIRPIDYEVTIERFTGEYEQKRICTSCLCDFAISQQLREAKYTGRKPNRQT